VSLPWLAPAMSLAARSGTAVPTDKVGVGFSLPASALPSRSLSVVPAVREATGAPVVTPASRALAPASRGRAAAASGGREGRSLEPGRVEIRSPFEGRGAAAGAGLDTGCVPATGPGTGAVPGGAVGAVASARGARAVVAAIGFSNAGVAAGVRPGGIDAGRFTAGTQDGRAGGAEGARPADGVDGELAGRGAPPLEATAAGRPDVESRSAAPFPAGADGAGLDGARCPPAVCSAAARGGSMGSAASSASDREELGSHS